MKKGITYLLCPDRTCKLFNKKPIGNSCEFSCPFKESKLKKLVVCGHCGGIAELPGFYTSWQYLPHNTKTGGCGATIKRIDFEYKRIYKKPK